MTGHRVLLGALAVTALALAPACRNTAEGVKEDTRQNSEKVGDAAQKVGETGRSIGHEAKEAGGKIADEAKVVGEAIKEGAKEVASDVEARKQTVDVKAALMVAKNIDASHIDVDTDAETKTVTLKGTVPTAAQKAAAERVAGDKAEGYKILNLLTVAGT
jgi:hyperosmotically inducible periplasmic protein